MSVSEAFGCCGVMVACSIYADAMRPPVAGPARSRENLCVSLSLCVCGLCGFRLIKSSLSFFPHRSQHPLFLPSQLPPFGCIALTCRASFLLLKAADALPLLLSPLTTFPLYVDTFINSFQRSCIHITCAVKQIRTQMIFNYRRPDYF